MMTLLKRRCIHLFRIQFEYCSRFINKNKFFVLLFFCPLVMGKVYLVKNGDSLSTIAQSHFPGRVYGLEGSLNKIIQLNPHIANPNIIIPGTSVNLEIEQNSVIPEIKPEKIITPKETINPKRYS